MSDDSPDNPEVPVTRTAFSHPPPGAKRQRRTYSPLNQDPFSQQPLTYPQSTGGSDPDPLPTDTYTEPALPKANFAEISERMGTAFTGIVMLGFSGLVLLRKLQRRNTTIRRPTEAEASAVSEPLARIVARHSPMEFASTFANDILDASVAAGAVSDYIDNSVTPKLNTSSVQTEGTVS